MNPPVLTSLRTMAEQTLRIKTKELARRMAVRDADILRGSDILVHEFTTSRKWTLDEPVVATVTSVDVEEADDFIDVRVRFRFKNTYVCGEPGGFAYGRTYEVDEKDGAW